MYSLLHVKMTNVTSSKNLTATHQKHSKRLTMEHLASEQQIGLTVKATAEAFIWMEALDQMTSVSE